MQMASVAFNFSFYVLWRQQSN